ncbi:hypothetical protein GCM10023191_059520 [Actinoallomurus oryzae]|uniref:Uncharacterized protein n=1 Tax=Actinoallomurus oryzae TaxID=502180 RepID=A0ABP8QL10_9ACTN
MAEKLDASAGPYGATTAVPPMAITVAAVTVFRRMDLVIFCSPVEFGLPDTVAGVRRRSPREIIMTVTRTGVFLPAAAKITTCGWRSRSNSIAGTGWGLLR